MADTPFWMPSTDTDDYVDLADKVERLQNTFIAQATNGSPDSVVHAKLRRELLDHATIGPLLPRFVRTYRGLAEFWPFIQKKFPTYAERRTFIWDEFRPAMEAAERDAGVGEKAKPADKPIEAILAKLSAAAVQEAWDKALSRREDDPDGALTAARTLLETTCKHVLTDLNVTYDDTAELPALYRLVAQQLNLAPDQHTEQVFKQILGGCTSVVQGLGTIRSRLGDAHGGGPLRAKPAARHAQLAVNLAGAMACFIVDTWQARK